VAGDETTGGALQGVRVLDLTRILAGPTCTQTLGDLGADILKVEKPGAGDDTRRWGPPFLTGRDGAETHESGYFLSANRNKRSIALDVANEDGRALLHRLLAESDVLIENFKVGDLARYGLDYASLAPRYPRLVYCSITGFGQSGPYANRAGYDYLAQGMGGIMSLTGNPDGEPMKVGMATADLVTGLYATIAILAALRHRDRTGEGQHLDLALLDCQLAFMTFEVQNYLLSGEPPRRRGNAHPTIVPYQVFRASDDYFILAIGNDRQFERFCAFADLGGLAEDGRFATASARVRNRDTLIPQIAAAIAVRPRAHWLTELERVGVPAGPVYTIPQTLADEHVRARGAVTQASHVYRDELPLLRSPIRLSATPTSVNRAPPTLGQHTAEVLAEIGVSPSQLAELRARGIV
jgi:crotonobetainyl-CoA:carnitine CoA-transferase CaiB-like acyl-CoA transferase